jgi:hypothetical protein
MKKKIMLINKVSEKGQSLVEVTFAFIVMLYLLLGAVQFSLALFQYVTMNDAAQEGAIYGSVNPEDLNGIKQRAVDTASDLIQLDPSQVSVSLIGDEYCEGRSDGGNGDPNAIEVEISHPHKIFMPLVGSIIGTDTINLKTVTTNTILHPSCD